MDTFLRYHKKNLIFYFRCIKKQGIMQGPIVSSTVTCNIFHVTLCYCDFILELLLCTILEILHCVTISSNFFFTAIPLFDFIVLRFFFISFVANFFVYSIKFQFQCILLAQWSIVHIYACIRNTVSVLLIDLTWLICIVYILRITTKENAVRFIFI